MKESGTMDHAAGVRVREVKDRGAGLGARSLFPIPPSLDTYTTLVALFENIRASVT